MAKKFTPPHDEYAIGVARATVGDLQAKLTVAKDALYQLESENRAAERAEEVRKARVMTPTMLAALERLAGGEYIRAYHPIGNRPTKYEWNGAFADYVNTAIYDRLHTAEYIRDGKITILGRQALADAKSK